MGVVATMATEVMVAIVAAVVAASVVAILTRPWAGQRPQEDTALRQGIGEILATVRSLQQEGREIRDKLVATYQGAESLTRALDDMRSGFAPLRGLLEAREEERRVLVQSIRRVEGIIAGSPGRGLAGERIVEELLAVLPPAWHVRNHRVGTKTVEFAIRLPNGRLLPVDSKFPAEMLVPADTAEDDPEALRRLRQEAENVLRRRASEVRQYIDPNTSMPFALVVVPDGLYRLALAALPELARDGIIVVGHSLFLPYVLLLMHTVLEASQDIDMERLAHTLSDVQRRLERLEHDAETRLAKPLTTIRNYYQELRSALAFLAQQVSAVRAQSLPPGEGREQPSLPDLNRRDSGA